MNFSGKAENESLFFYSFPPMYSVKGGVPHFFTLVEKLLNANGHYHNPILVASSHVGAFLLNDDEIQRWTKDPAIVLRNRV